MIIYEENHDGNDNHDDDNFGDDHVLDCTRRCPSTFLPVCGSNGQTYSNECNLRYYHDERVSYHFWGKLSFPGEIHEFLC